MNYLRKSGGSVGMDQAVADLPSVMERDANDEDCISGVESYSEEHPNRGNADESDSDSFNEEESSDSDYD